MNGQELKAFLTQVFGKVEQNFNQVVENLRRENPDLAERLEKSGYSIFYTNPLNTLRKGDVYYLGLNPGGQPDPAYRDRYEDLGWFGQLDPDWCAFLDGCWGAEPGQAPLQRRTIAVLCWVLTSLGSQQTPRDVFSTNLYFLRSEGAEQLLQYGQENIKWCLAYHKEFLKIVQPKVIVCNGNGRRISAFYGILNILRSEHINIPEEESTPLNGNYHLRWVVAEDVCWKNGQRANSRVLILGLPHLSHYAPNRDVYDLMSELIRDCFRMTR